MSRDRPAPGGLFPLNGTPIPRVGFGMMQLSRKTDGAPGKAQAVELLHQAFDMGISLFDTAQFYGNGLANELLRTSFADRRDQVVIASKAGTMQVPGAAIPVAAAQKPRELRAAVVENLRSLGTDRIDIVNLRRMDFGPRMVAEGDQLVPLEDQLDEMAAMRAEGMILGIGLSHVTIGQLRTALPLGIACVQNFYNLNHRQDEPMLDLCAENGIAWIPYFALGAHFRTPPEVTTNPTVQHIADQLGASPFQVGLAWQLAHSPNTLIIPGTSNPDHLAENTRAGYLQLDQDMLAALDAIDTDR